MEVAPFFVNFHHFLSIFTIFYRFSRFTHFCRNLHFVAIYALFPQIFLAKIAFSVTSHVFCMYGEKTYKCGFCEKSFNQLGNLRTHERLHTGELEFMCSECGKCYNTRSNLGRHACNRRLQTSGGYGYKS